MGCIFKMEINSNTLSKYKARSLFIRYAVPGILGYIMSSMAVFVDGIFVAKYVGAEAFAAVNIVWPVVAITFGIYIMLVAGSIPIAGKFMGEGKMLRANLVFSQTVIIISTIASSPLIFVYIFKDFLQPMLGAHGEILLYSNRYILPLLVGTFFWGIAYALIQFAKLNGSPRYAAYTFALAALMNIILDYLFVAVLDLSIEGAGWATAISYIFSFIMGLCYYFRKKCKFKLIKIYDGFSFIGKAALNGFSEFLSNASSGIIPWLFNITAYKFAGNSGILAYSVANYALMFFVTIAYSIGESIQPLVSISYGASKPKKISAFLKIALISTSVLAVLGATLLFINPSILSNPLLNDVEAKTYEQANYFMRFLTPAFIFVGINIVMSAYYTAVQCAGASASVSFLRAILLPIPLIFILSHFLGFKGLVLVLPLVEVMTFFVAILLFKRRKPDNLIDTNKNMEN